MNVIKDKIDSTISNLQEKRAILVKHKSQYNDLKFRLMDFAQYKETDKPTVDVRLNPKAIVKGHIVNPQKVLVFLGCEYFVERDPIKSVALVENKLRFLNNAIEEFDSKIKEAETTVENIGHLEDYEKRQLDKSDTIPKSESTSSPVKEIEENLPFMDIREELDEEGNVITSTIQKQDENKIKEFGERHGIDILDNDSDDQLSELLNDMEIKPRMKIQELPSEQENAIPQELKNGISEKENDEIKDDKVELRNPRTGNVDNSKSSQVEDEFYELLNQMGISDAVDKRASQNRKQEPSGTEKEQEDAPEEIKELPQPSQSGGKANCSKDSSWEQYDSQEPAISSEDILQLQLIADELEEDGDYDYDYKEDTFEHAVDQDSRDEDGDREGEDDEDDDDWDFNPDAESLVPEAYRNLFTKELERVRGENIKLETPVNTKDEPVENSPRPTKKKSVSFAPNLQIKEIENVSEEMKNAPDISKVSKFKQMRMNNAQPMLDDDLQEGEIIEAAVSDLIVEKDISEPLTQNTVMSKVMEEEQKEHVEFPKAKVSKFKQRNGAVLKPNSPGISVPVEPSDPAHNIKTKQVQANDGTLGRDSIQPVVDIVERGVIGGITEEGPVLSKVNTTHSQSKGNVIRIPENEPSYFTDNSEYHNIKAYIENEEDDEDELNALTDLEVYTAADFDENGDFIEGEGEDDEEDEEEDGDHGNVLVDEIVENDEVDDPSYYIDENLLQKEYQDLRRKMIAKYVTDEDKDSNANSDKIIISNDHEKESELEPIDESGNPIRVSRFRQSMTK